MGMGSCMVGHVNDVYPCTATRQQRDEARAEAAQAVERFATTLEEQQWRQAQVLAAQQQVGDGRPPSSTANTNSTPILGSGSASGGCQSGC